MQTDIEGLMKPRYVKCPDGSINQIVGYDSDIKLEFCFINGAKCFIEGDDYSDATELEYTTYLNSLK